MKTRILRSVLLVAYIGFALSGQLGTLSGNAVASNTHGSHTALIQAAK